MKKAQYSMITYLVIGVFILVLLIPNLGQNVANAGETAGDIFDRQLANNLLDCQTKEGIDGDGDGLPDGCDNCPLRDNLVDGRLPITKPRGEIYAVCEKTDKDQDADCFVVDCCGNYKDRTGKSTYLKVDQGIENREYKSEPNTGKVWCGTKQEDDTNPRKKPKYDP